MEQNGRETNIFGGGSTTAAVKYTTVPAQVLRVTPLRGFHSIRGMHSGRSYSLRYPLLGVLLTVSVCVTVAEIHSSDAARFHETLLSRTMELRSATSFSLDPSRQKSRNRRFLIREDERDGLGCPDEGQGEDWNNFDLLLQHNDDCLDIATLGLNSRTRRRRARTRHSLLAKALEPAIATENFPNGEEGSNISLLPPRFARNSANGMHQRLLKTGTTIAGVCGADFCVLGADTRATNDRLVADKACAKIHKLAANVYACGAGTSADLEHVTRQVYYTTLLQSQDEAIGNAASVDGALASSSSHVASVASICRFLQDILYDQGGSCQATLIVGGVYKSKAMLRAIHPHGSQDALAFTALGSGGMAAMGVLESSYRHDLTLEEAIELVTRAITAGIVNDLGSGSQVDLCIITAEGTDYRRCAVPEEQLQNFNGESSFVESPANTRKQNDESLNGVNGFGNMPFNIKSRRIVAVTPEVERASKEQEWAEILSLPPSTAAL